MFSSTNIILEQEIGDKRREGATERDEQVRSQVSGKMR